MATFVKNLPIYIQIYVMKFIFAIRNKSIQINLSNKSVDFLL